MDKNDDQRRQQTLDTTSGGGATSPATAGDQLLQPWSRLAEKLSPLIGDSGFCALYGRATRLVNPEFGWLAANHSGNSIESLLGALQDGFASVEAAIAQPANTALLNTFTKLLSALIGEALTRRVLDAATDGWDEQKNAQEHK
jgi:hypothetical protein